MARKVRIEKNGFYHIINRGVAKSAIFNDEYDHLRFLEILQDASEDYEFEIYSFCLMSNHYHLLMQIKKENLSIIMQKVNSRYSMYFNHKYKRVGPLWQGRFKSWYIYDESYLQTLIRYIEFNPIKANITKKIGKYKWAMSSNSVKFSMLNYELIERIDFTKALDEKELKKVDEFYRVKLEIKNDSISQKKRISLENYFKKYPKEQAIYKAVKDGYTQSQIAKYLNLSNVAISKILKIYKQKIALFDKLRDRGIFWSYSNSITYDKAGEKLTIEYLLKYGDFDDIVLGFKLFGKRVMKRVWKERLESDRRFIKLNLMLARVFFGMDVEADYFKGMKNVRSEKLKLLAS